MTVFFIFFFLNTQVPFATATGFVAEYAAANTLSKYARTTHTHAQTAHKGNRLF